MIVALLNLTPLDARGEEDSLAAIRVAVDKIECINTDVDGDTYITTLGGSTLWVDESFDEVFEQLSNLLNAVNGVFDD